MSVVSRQFYENRKWGEVPLSKEMTPAMIAAGVDFCIDNGIDGAGSLERFVRQFYNVIMSAKDRKHR